MDSPRRSLGSRLVRECESDEHGPGTTWDPPKRAPCPSPVRTLYKLDETSFLRGFPCLLASMPARLRVRPVELPFPAQGDAMPDRRVQGVQKSRSPLDGTG